MENNWTFIIKPKRGWFEIDLKEIWNYRALYLIYIKRSLITVYKQTILGPLWFLIRPVFTIIMYMFVFGGIAGISTEGAPQPLFYLSGIMLWSYFNDSFLNTSNVFIENIYLFDKVYFPRLIIPLAQITSNFLKMGISLALFVILYIWYLLNGAPLHVNWALCLFPLLMLMLALHAFSWGLVISAITTKYRDLKILVEFGIQLFMYATPIVYPLSAMPERYRPIIELNPLTSIFEAFKYGCMGCGQLNWGGLLYSVLFMIIMVVFSVLVFNRVERNFIDSI